MKTRCKTNFTDFYAVTDEKFDEKKFKNKKKFLASLYYFKFEILINF